MASVNSSFEAYMAARLEREKADLALEESTAFDPAATSTLELQRTTLAARRWESFCLRVLLVEADARVDAANKLLRR